MQSLYWEHPNGKICFRALFEADTKVLTGVNAFGLRLRHNFFDKALRNGSTIEEVLTSLDKADFNGEFFDKGYQQDIIRTYNEQFDASLQVKKKKGFFSFFRSSSAS